MNLKDIVGNIFYTDKKEQDEQAVKSANVQKTMNNVFVRNSNSYEDNVDTGRTSTTRVNPFQDLLAQTNPTKITPDLIRQKAMEYLSLTPKGVTNTDSTANETATTPQDIASDFDANLDSGGLASLDVASELPKLSEEQISSIISKHFSKSTIISPSDAKGIYEAQQKSGMSALAILGIGALESGYGTSNIAKQKNNLWGWNATNTNPSGNATTFSPVSQGALEFANSFMKTYYNGYGAKSIYSAGTGENPSGKGYAYFDNGTINPQWATSVGSIMGTLYNTAKATSSSSLPNSSNGSITESAKKYLGTPYVWGGESMDEGGMDCSGFVYSALKDAGYNVGRTTAQGYRNYGSTVSKSNMQPGDLIFYGKNNEASHIGIYLGNGQMIHSSGGSKNTKSNPGKGVTVSNVDYRSDFIEARRY